MLEQFLRARLPEQIVALIENLEQNPDTSHLGKVYKFAVEYENDITKFERWMLSRAVSKVRKLVKRDELLRSAMEIVINAPEEKVYDPSIDAYRYKANGRYSGLGLGQNTVISAQELHENMQKAQQAQNTWIDSKSLSSASNKLF